MTKGLAGAAGRWPVVPVLLAVMLLTEPVSAYRFWAPNQFDLVAAGAAMKWNDDSLP